MCYGSGWSRRKGCFVRAQYVCVKGGTKKDAVCSESGPKQAVKGTSKGEGRDYCKEEGSYARWCKKEHAKQRKELGKLSRKHIERNIHKFY